MAESKVVIIVGIAIQVTKLFEVFLEVLDALNFVTLVTPFEMVKELKW